MKRKIIFSVLTFVLFSTFSFAQYSYGGSAHVFVKHKQKGTTRVINTTYPCTKDDESSAKAALKSSLEYFKHSYEEFSSGVYYSIDRLSDNNKKFFGGTAWVEVKDKNGKTRVLNADWPCTVKDIGAAKGKLLDNLHNQKHSDEEYTDQVHYDIDTCD